MIDFETAMTDVSKAFDRPVDILNDKDLSHEKQVKLLHQWETDLRQLMVASDENMTGSGGGKVAQLLQDVQHCLRELGAGNKGESSAPSQAGGAPH